MSARLNRGIRAELADAVASNLLTVTQMQRIAERYPTSRWDVLVLIRWFTILGAVAMGAGLVILAPTWVNLELLVEGGLAASSAALIAGGLWLQRQRGMLRTGGALQLCGAFALQGLTVAVAHYHSHGSKNWPALVGLDTALQLALAYALQSRLILILACVDFFTFFGGETGYVSGWGAYWLGMDYPLRFIAAGLAAVAVGVGHFRWLRGALQGFSRVYFHFGLLVLNLALWFFALFGYFEKEVRWEGTTGERLAFSLLWALAAAGALAAGIRFGLKLLRGYGLVFLIINVYTFYFQFVVANSADLWFVHMLLVGGSMVVGGLFLERARSLVGDPE
jgi:hypothetical protein